MDDVVTPKTDHEIGEPLPGRRLHFVGVGGSGMSGLARLVRQRGAEVSGSDRGDTPGMAAVRAAGIDVTLEQTAAAVPAACDTLVVSAAIPGDHPEVVEARRRGVEVVKYAAMLGRLMGQSGTAGVAIAGTHGKSTTTAILCHVLLSAGLDPSFILGAHCAQIGGGSRAGGGSVSGGWGLLSGG
ncbi:MAG: Mur ligase domain-containing protein [Planctomycetota bacterium]